MREKEISHKRAADPPKNSPEMTGPFPSFDESRRRVDAENGSFITANSFPKSELDTLSSTWCTRSHYSSVAKTLSSSSGARRFSLSWSWSTMIGKVSQQHRSFLTGVPYVQRSCRSRWSRDTNMICRHLRQTYTNSSIPIRGGRLNKSATILDETKYFEQYVVRKRVDCCRMSVTLPFVTQVSARCRRHVSA